MQREIDGALWWDKYESAKMFWSPELTLRSQYLSQKRRHDRSVNRTAPVLFGNHLGSHSVPVPGSCAITPVAANSHGRSVPANRSGLSVSASHYSAAVPPLHQEALHRHAMSASAGYPSAYVPASHSTLAPDNLARAPDAGSSARLPPDNDFFSTSRPAVGPFPVSPEPVYDSTFLLDDSYRTGHSNRFHSGIIEPSARASTLQAMQQPSPPVRDMPTDLSKSVRPNEDGQGLHPSSGHDFDHSRNARESGQLKLARAFHSWRSFAIDSKRKRKRLVAMWIVAIKWWKERKLRGSMRLWRDKAYQIREFSIWQAKRAVFNALLLNVVKIRISVDRFANSHTVARFFQLWVQKLRARSQNQEKEDTTAQAVQIKKNTHLIQESMMMWISETRIKKLDQSKQEILQRRWAQRLKIQAWNVWRMRIKLEKRGHRLLHTNQLNLITRLFVHWRRRMLVQRYRDETYCRLAVESESRRTVRFFRLWLDRTRLRKTDHHKHQKAIAHHEKASKSRALEVWKHWYFLHTKERYLHQLMDREAQTKAFHRWAMQYKLRKRVKTMALRLCAGKVFQAWLSWARRKRDLNRKSNEFLQAASVLGLRTSMTIWSGALRTRQNFAEKLRTYQAARSTNIKQSCLRLWMTALRYKAFTVVAAFGQKKRALAAWTRVHRHVSVVLTERLVTFVSVQDKAYLIQAFAQWRTQLNAIQTNWTLGGTKSTEFTLRVAFAQWKREHDSHSCSDQSARQFAVQHAQHHAFGVWTQRHTQIKEQRMMEEHARIQEICRTQLIWNSFRSWHKFTRTMRTLDTSLKSVQESHMTRLQVIYFQRWWLGAKRLNRAMLVAKAFRHGNLARHVLDKWRVRLAQERTHAATVKRIESKTQQSLVHRSFAIWKLLYQKSARLLDIERKVIQQSGVRRLCLFVAKWRSKCESNRASKMEHAAVELFGRRHRRKHFIKWIGIWNAARSKRMMKVKLMRHIWSMWRDKYLESSNGWLAERLYLKRLMGIVLRNWIWRYRRKLICGGKDAGLDDDPGGHFLHGLRQNCDRSAMPQYTCNMSSVSLKSFSGMSTISRILHTTDVLCPLACDPYQGYSSKRWIGNAHSSLPLFASSRAGSLYSSRALPSTGGPPQASMKIRDSHILGTYFDRWQTYNIRRKQLLELSHGFRVQHLKQSAMAFWQRRLVLMRRQKQAVKIDKTNAIRSALRKWKIALTRKERMEKAASKMYQKWDSRLLKRSLAAWHNQSQVAFANEEVAAQLRERRITARCFGVWKDRDTRVALSMDVSYRRYASDLITRFWRLWKARRDLAMQQRREDRQWDLACQHSVSRLSHRFLQLLRHQTELRKRVVSCAAKRFLVHIARTWFRKWLSLRQQHQTFRKMEDAADEWHEQQAIKWTVTVWRTRLYQLQLEQHAAATYHRNLVIESWNAWYSRLASILNERLSNQMYMRHFLAQAWVTWRSGFHCRQGIRAIESKADILTARRHSKAIKAAFHAWQSKVKHRHRLRSHERQLLVNIAHRQGGRPADAREMTNEVLRDMINCRAAFNLWRRKLTIQTKVKKLHKDHLLRRALMHWQIVTTQSSICESQKVILFTQTQANRKLSISLWVWKEHYRAKIARKTRISVLSRHFARWRLAVDAAKEQQDRQAVYIEQSLQRRFFSTWRRSMGMRIADSHSSQRRLHFAWNQWKLFQRLAKREHEESVNTLQAKHRKAVVAAAFDLWRQRTAQRNERRQLARLKRKVFTVWRDWASIGGLAKRIALQRSFRRWVWHLHIHQATNVDAQRYRQHRMLQLSFEYWHWLAVKRAQHRRSSALPPRPSTARAALHQTEGARECFVIPDDTVAVARSQNLVSIQDIQARMSVVDYLRLDDLCNAFRLRKMRHKIWEPWKTKTKQHIFETQRKLIFVISWSEKCIQRKVLLGWHQVVSDKAAGTARPSLVRINSKADIVNDNLILGQSFEKMMEG
ncbi:uncharacterized protein BJ171DRAFT_488001 [Polychytrium aggregatum]|uniref:uncharacterized protein n=1 Tax=Polychytrium aggregatum TaxID=110093 RepID=UPI0022FECB07|nr:uncharacterized protein BJ171DRAFT_488001 [Polychytrium aggregatum]KAI9208971.1 hypothetical protein BJ171DRAFT_488001 [Polychytrium aggregatum]